MSKKKAGKSKKYNAIVATAPPPARVQIINLNGSTYLGEVHSDGQLHNVLPLPGTEVSDTSLREYVMADNAGDLDHIEVLGSNVLLTVRNLSEVQALTLDSYQATMSLAKRTAIPVLENARFEELVKK